MTTVARRSANRRLLAGADSFQMVSRRGRGYRLGPGGLWEAAAGGDGQSQQVEMTFLQQSLQFWPSTLLLPVISPIIKKNGDKQGVRRGSQDPGIPREGVQGAGVSDLQR